MSFTKEQLFSLGDAISHLKEENIKLTGWLATAHENADAKIHNESAGLIIEENDKLKEENEKLKCQYELAIQIDNKEISALKEQVEELEEQVEELEGDKEELWEEREENGCENKELRKENAVIRGENEKLRKENDTAGKLLVTAHAQVEWAEKQTQPMIDKAVKSDAGVAKLYGDIAGLIKTTMELKAENEKLKINQK